MPVKPVAQPELWASNPLYTTGPFVGSASKVVPPAATAAEGHRPGALFPTAAEHENSQQNRITALARWVFLGSFAGAADAHLVETDATGRTTLHGATINDTADEIALQVTGVNTFVPTVLVTCTTGAVAVQVDLGASSGIAFNTGLGANAATGLSVSMTGTLAGGLGGGAGVLVTGDNASTAPALLVDHQGPGFAADITSGTLVGSAVRVRGGGSRALDVESSATAANQDALRATTLASAGAAIRARTSAAAGPNARAVHAAATDADVAIEAAGVNAEALRASSSGAGAAAIFLPGKAVDPIGVIDGRVDFNTTRKTLIVANNADAAYRDAWTSVGGIVLGRDQVTSVTAAVGGFVTALTVPCLGGSAPKLAGRLVLIRVTASGLRALVAPPAARSFDVQISASGLGVLATRQGVGSGNTAGFVLEQPTTNWQGSLVWDFFWTITAAGDRTFTVGVAASVGSCAARDFTATVLGSY